MTAPAHTSTIAQRLAAFATRASYDDMSTTAREQTKLRVLDALGCALGAIGASPVAIVRSYVEEFESSGPCTLIGGGAAAPDRAVLYNSALVRYLDFNDSYLAKGETCHPSDNLGAVLAAAEFADRSGRDLLAALALAYQVQCRLSDVAPVRAAGFDHVTQGTYAVAAGVARALGLDSDRTANAIAIAGTAFNALRVTRTGRFIRKVRLDELPQLWNVLRGDMSIIGPRPERPQFVSDFNAHIRYYALRHCVKPGLTGWAQLRYPYGSSMQDAEEKLKFDLFYVKIHNLAFDLAILVQTVEVVLFGRGAR